MTSGQLKLFLIYLDTTSDSRDIKKIFNHYYLRPLLETLARTSSH